MEEGTAIQLKEGQETNGRSDSYPMKGGTAGDQWQEEHTTNGGKGTEVCLLRTSVYCTLYTVHSTAGPWETAWQVDNSKMDELSGK
jgi:hypothetical protein